MRKAAYFVLAFVGLCAAVVEIGPRFLLKSTLYGSSCGYVGQIEAGRKFAYETIALAYDCGPEIHDEAVWRVNAQIVGKALDIEDDCQIFPFFFGYADYENYGEAGGLERLKGDAGRLADTYLLAADVARRTPDHMPGTWLKSALRERLLLWQSILVSGVLRNSIPDVDPTSTFETRQATLTWWRSAYIATMQFSKLAMDGQYDRFKKAGMFAYNDLTPW